MSNEAKERLIKRVIRHTRLVQDYAIFLELNKHRLPFEVNDFEIINKVIQHDLDKLHNEKVRESYLSLSEFIFKQENNLPFDKLAEETLSLRHSHYKTQDHHIEYHIENNTRPNDIIICEICCDLLAAAKRRDGDIGTAIQYLNTYCSKERLDEHFGKEFSEYFHKTALAIFEILREVESFHKDTKKAD